MSRFIVRRSIAGLIGVLLMCGPAAAAKHTKAPAPPRYNVPGDRQIAIMIKTSVIAFNHASLTGNYSVLRELAVPSFRKNNSVAQLAEIFKKMRLSKVDLGAIVLFQPKLTRKAWVNKLGLLRITGHFLTKPERVEFNLAYQVVGGKWGLYAIGVSTSKPKTAVTPPPGKKKKPGKQGAVRPGNIKPAKTAQSEAPVPARTPKQPASQGAQEQSHSSPASPEPATHTDKKKKPWFRRLLDN